MGSSQNGGFPVVTMGCFLGVRPFYQWPFQVPSGKRTKNYGHIHHIYTMLNGFPSTISMAMASSSQTVCLPEGAGNISWWSNKVIVVEKHGPGEWDDHGESMAIGTDSLELLSPCTHRAIGGRRPNSPSHRPRPAILRTVAVSSAARTGTVEAKSKASAEPFFAPGKAMELKGNHQVYPLVNIEKTIENGHL